MLKSAATKLAHNSTIPALAGNKALRPLQGLITAEKAIITSLVHLSENFSRASEALHVWGVGEGDDLSDTLGASTKLLSEFSNSLTNFATHEQAIRGHMKAVRSEEERLDTLRNRRKSVASKADSAERKLNKMDSAHKDAPAQSALLERLRDSMRELDSEILTEEARLGDLKRTVTNAWMILKFGGLQEFCRKGLIVAEAGKQIMAELPQVVTEPGLPRPLYTGHVRTEEYVAEALRALGEVSVDAAPSGSLQLPLDVNYRDGDSHTMPSALPDNESAVNFSRSGLSGDGDRSLLFRGNDASRPSLGEGGDYGKSLPTIQADEHGALLPQPDLRRFQSFNPRKPPPPNTFLGDDVPSSSQPIASSASTGGRFATFPVKGKQQDSVAPVIATPLASSMSSFSDAEHALLKGDADDAVPSYEAVEGTRTPPLAPPRGAAPPAVPYADIYGGYDPGSYDSEPPFVPDNGSEERGDDSQLPYMVSERRTPHGSRPLPMRPWAHPDREAASFDVPHGRASVSTEPDSIPNPVQAPFASTRGESMPPAFAQAPVFQNRSPTPPLAAVDPDDERALNAAAAREVSRELDSLMYHPPSVMPRGSPLQTSAPTPLSVPPMAPSPPRSSSDSFTQPSSTFARARGRVPGSPPTPRSPTEQPPPSYVSSSPHVVPAPASSMQQAQRPQASIGGARPSSPSLSSLNNPPLRTPPELPPSPTLVKRTLPQPSAVPHPPGKTPRSGAGMISVAAFRRPAPRTVSESQPLTGSRDASPLSIKKKDLRGSPNAPRISTESKLDSLPPLPGVSPPELPASPSFQEQHQEDEFDYIAAYYSSGGDEGGARSSILH